VVPNEGHKGLVLRPRCIGPEPKYYSILSRPSSCSNIRLGLYLENAQKEAHNPERLVPTVKHGGGSVTIWAANILVFCWSYNYSE
jgi:hypothetical protein